MNINKKYAIRKLAVGVVSISIGLFVSNSVDIESFTNSTSLQNVAKAEEVTNWQPEGNIIAQGEDGVPWELYENGYLLFKPTADKDTLTNSYGENQASWKKLHNDKIKAIGFSGKVYTPRDSRYLFSAANTSDYNPLSNLEYIESSKLDTSKTTYMYSMFSYLEKLKELDVSHFNTSQVDSMTEMLKGLKEVKTLDVSNWDISNVTAIDDMFLGDEKLETLDVSKWQTSKIKYMSNVFYNNYKLKSLDVSRWNTSSATSISGIFSSAYELTELDVSNWDVSNVTSMYNAFEYNKKLKTLDLSRWNTSKVKYMSGMFAYNENLTELNLGNWNTSNVVDMHNMFLNDRNLVKLNITNWDTSNVEDINGMFSGLESLTHLTIGENFKNTTLKDNLFKNLDTHKYENIYTNRWHKEDNSKGPYTTQEWNNEYRANSSLLAGVWVREKVSTEYTVNFVTGTSENINPKKVEKDVPLDTPTPTVDKTGYKFLGWSKTPDGELITDKTNITTPGETITLYAKWEKVNNVVKRTEKINKTKIYKTDDSLDLGVEQVEEGRDGEKEIINTYSITPITGELTNPITTENVITEMKPEIITVGTKPKVEVEEIPSPVKYEKDPTREKGKPNLIIEGVPGSKTIITTYNVDPNTGQITENVGTPVIKEPTTKIIRIPAKDKIVVEEIPSPIKYEKDPTREKGKPNLIIEGIPGSKTTTTTYNVDPKTGEITEKVVVPLIKEPTTKIIRIPAKDKVEVTEIPATVRYKKDPTREIGKPNLIIESGPGSKTVVTTYNVDPKTGEITEKVGIPLIKEPLIEKTVIVPAKDKVVVEEIPSPVRYEKDPTREKGKPNLIIEGEPGSKTTTTTYNVDPKTGEVSESKISTDIKHPKDKRVYVPAKDKVEEIVKPIEIKELFNKDLLQGKERIITHGKPKKERLITEYKVNEKTGEITEVQRTEIVDQGEPTIKEIGTKKPTKKIVDPSGKEIPKEELTNYTEPNLAKEDGVTPEGDLFYIVKKIEVEYKGSPTLEKGNQIVEKDGKKDGKKVVRVGTKTKVELLTNKDNEKIKRTTTYVVDPKTGEITPTVKEEVTKVGEPLVENKMNVAIIQDEEGNILDIVKIEEKPKPIDGYENTGKEKVDKEGNKVYIYKKTTETSKGTDNPPVVENKDFVGGVTPSDPLIREELPELKVAIIKDSEDNILDVIKLEEEPKEIKGYKNTGKTTTDKEGNKVYIYEKVKENKKTVVEDKKVNLKENNNKEIIKKKEELPKTSTSMLAPFGLLTGLALRKKKK